MKRFAISVLFGSLSVMQPAAAYAAPVKKVSITPADIRAAAAALELTVKKGKIFDSCEMEAAGPERIDLNKDGQPELVFGDGMCLGGNAGWFGIAARLPSGRWHEILSSQGVYKVLKTSRQGWADIQVGGPGCEGSDPKYSWVNGAYRVSSRTPRHCTDGAASTGNPAKPPAVWQVSFPQSVEYIGYTGSEQFPVFNNFRITNSGGVLGGSGFMQMGIFSGAAPLTGTYANGECSVIRKKQTYRGACNGNEFIGFIYNAKGKQGEPFRFRTEAYLAQIKAGRAAGTPVAYAPSAPVTIGVWSLGRARFLVEPRGGCPPELALGTRRYCFNQVIDWLQRHPEKQSVDVVAMESAWLPGSVIPHNNGQGWDIYNVAREGAGFAAKTKRHYGTQVRIPQGCMVQGVAQEAWLIGVSGRGKVAIEAEEYACAGGWGGGPVYRRYLDAQDFDGAPGDIRFTLAASGGSSPYVGGTDSRQGYGAGGYNPGGSYDAPPQPAAGYDYRAGTSVEIYGAPNTGGTPAKPKAKRKR